MPKSPSDSAIGKYVGSLADRMGLSEWTITVLRTGALPNAAASVVCADSRRECVIRLADNFFTNSPEEQRIVFTHELIHLHVEAALETVGDLEDHITPAIWDIFHKGFRRQYEYSVDALATALAKFMPMPPWVATKG